MFHRSLAVLAMTACLIVPAQADDVSDTIQSALDAYNEGDIKYATEELAYAQQLLKAMKSDSLSAYLPDAPEGWTRTIDTEMANGMSMMGGGVGTKAEYSNGSSSFSITMMADNPMVAAMGGMFGNTAMMAAMGKMIRVKREKFVDQNGEMSALIDNRVLVQASGADTEIMIPVLETMDFRALGAFGN